MIKPTWLLPLALSIAASFAAGNAHAAKPASDERRVTIWAPSVTLGGPTFRNQTLRMVAHPSAAGSSVRIRLSNLRSTTPLQVDQATLGVQARGATAVEGSLLPVKVAGATRFAIPAGGEVYSDPVPMSVQAEQNLLISLYLPQSTSTATWHSDAFDTTYLSEADSGNHADKTDGASYTKTSTSWYYVSAVDVLSKLPGTVVAFGDSITDGYATPTGAYARWPDFLARRLAAAKHPWGVVDAGIGGNRVLTDTPNIWQGISAIKRFSHDALTLPGVRTVVLMEGINDIGNDASPDSGPLTAQHLIEGYRALIKQARDAGIRIIGGTLLPNKGASYYNESREAIRLACNEWIRTSGAFDGVIDFDAALRDPADPARMRTAYDSGDHLHPNAAGMEAMANAVDLALLTKTKQTTRGRRVSLPVEG